MQVGLPLVFLKNGFLELELPVKKAAVYRVRVLATCAPDFGIVRVSLDGKTCPEDFDLYSGRVSPSGSLELGQHQLSTGKHRLRFTVVGNNASSSGFVFGLDTIDLLKVE